MLRRITICILLLAGVHFGLLPLSVGHATVAGQSSASREAYLQAFAQGDAALQARQPTAAISAFQQALQAAPNDARARYRLAQARLAANQPAPALADLQILLSTVPGNLDARTTAAECLARLGKPNEAKAQLDWVLRTQPDHPAANELSRRLAAGPAPAGDTTVPSPSTVQPAPATAGLPRNAGTPAIQPPTVMIQATPAANGPQVRNPPARPEAPRSGASPNRPALDNRAANRTDASVSRTPAKAADGKTAPPSTTEPEGDWQVPAFLQRAADSYGVQVEYGKYCLEKDDLEKAGRHLASAEKMAIESRDNRRFLEVTLHRALHALYRLDLDGFGKRVMTMQPFVASDTYQRFLDTYNKATQAPNELERLRLVAGIAMGTEHPAVAIRLLRRVLELDGTDGFAMRLLAQAYLDNGEMEFAEKAFHTLARMSPSDPEPYANLARFYLTARYHPPAAQQFAEQLLRMNPKDARGQLFRGMALVGTGQISEAIAQLQTVANHAGLQGDLPELAKSLITKVNELRNMPAAQRQIQFARLLALPGSHAGGPGAMTMRGDSLLERGSFFGAFKAFIAARNLPEIGRTYLAMSVRLQAIGDDLGAAVATEFGLSALHAALKRDAADAKAHLYLAIYHLEHREEDVAGRHIQAGLATKSDDLTRNRLLALKRTG